MHSIVADVRFAVRMLIKQPGFTIVAVATLALGIGANTAIFSLVNTVLLKPLPYPNSQELVRLWSSNPAQGRDRYFTSPLSYYRWLEQNETFAGIAAAWPREVTLVDDVDSPVRIRTMSATLNWFDILGVAPHLGRMFHPEDIEAARGSWLLVLSHGSWQDRFGADSSVIGATVRIDGQAAEIIGVLPPGTAFPETVDLFTSFVPPLTQNGQYMDVIARLKPSVSSAAGLADLHTIAKGLEEEHPGPLKGWSVDMAPLYEVVVGDVRPALLILMAATGLVLIAACANVANLLLARTEKRHREVALRAALGAGRGRLVRQLLTESVVLGGVGTALGLLVALFALKTLANVAPASLPRFDGVSLDLVMLGVALGSAVVTGIAFGLAPALQLLGIDLQLALKDGGHRTSGTRRRIRARDVLVITQMALAVVVSVGAGLLMKSFANLRDTDTGFTATGVLTFEVNLPASSYPTLEHLVDSYEAVLDRLRVTPTVENVGLTSSLPLSTPLDYLLQVLAVGEPPPEAGNEPHAWYRQVSPEFFRTVGVPLVRGRAFTERDRGDSPPVVIVNRTLARSLFGDADPIGRQLSGVHGRFGPLGEILNNRTEIVGVVDDVRYGNLREPAAPSLYFPYRQAPFRRMTVVVRSNVDPALIVPRVRQEIAELDPNLPLGNVTTLADAVERSIARDKFAMLLISVFGAVALALSAVGIYGVLSYTVVQRTRELGVRIALGANRSSVFRLVMTQMALKIGAGVGVGVLAAAVATRAISSQLFGVTTHDPITFGAVIILLIGVGGIASYLPSSRATRISPLTAFREEG